VSANIDTSEENHESHGEIIKEGTAFRLTSFT
jgi:hypothetical protein